MQQARRCRVFCVVLQRAVAGRPHDPVHAARLRFRLGQQFINIGLAVGHADEPRARHFGGELLAAPQHVDPALAFLLFDGKLFASRLAFRRRQGRLVRSGPNARGDRAQGNAVRGEGVQRMQERAASLAAVHRTGPDDLLLRPREIQLRRVLRKITTGCSATRRRVASMCGCRTSSKQSRSFSNKRYAAAISAYPPHAAGMLAVGCPANCESTMASRSFNRLSGRSAVFISSLAQGASMSALLCLSSPPCANFQSLDCRLFVAIPQDQCGLV